MITLAHSKHFYVVCERLHLSGGSGNISKYGISYINIFQQTTALV